MECFADDEVSYAADNCPDPYNLLQKDSYPQQGNGIGDACDCEGDIDVDDIRAFLSDFGRGRYNEPCTNDWCDGAVDSEDLTMIVEDLGRFYYNNPCPDCQGGDWCNYY